MTRLFVAAWPTDEVTDRLLDLASIEPAGGERRVAPEQWHVTLRFIGPADIDEVTDRLRSATFTTVTAVIGPAVVALGDRSAVVPVAGVEPLAGEVRAATAGIGHRDERAFYGHLTVARLRTGARSTLLGAEVSGSFTIDRIALVRSDPGSDRAAYTTIDQFPTTP